MNLSRRFYFYAVVICVIISAVAIGLAALRPWLAIRQAESKIAALRADGQPITLTDLGRPPIPLELNGATYLRAARHDLESMDLEWSNADTEEHQLLKSQGKSDREIYEILDRDEWPTDWRQRAIAATFDAYPSVVPLLERAAQCDDFDWRFDLTLPADQFMVSISDFCQLKRQSARAFGNWALLQATRGEPDDALRACTTLLRLARLYDRESTQINHLVDQGLRGVALFNANKILQSQSSTASTRAALRDELVQHDSLEALRHALITERAFGLTCFRDGVSSPWATFVNYNVNDYLDAMQSLLALVDAPFNESPPAVIDEWRSSRIAECRSQAYVRCLLVLLALLERPKLVTQREIQIDDLKLPAKTITDPFNDGKIKLRKVAGGWLVYSVGQDLKDDGGDIGLETMKDIGIGPGDATVSHAVNQ